MEEKVNGMDTEGSKQWEENYSSSMGIHIIFKFINLDEIQNDDELKWDTKWWINLLPHKLYMKNKHQKPYIYFSFSFI